jgi:hypothetical protein
MSVSAGTPQQLSLPGLEEFFDSAPSYKWAPRPATLAKVKDYFRGFAARRRPIYPQRAHVAKKLGIAVRTLARYLAWLDAEGWLKTTLRKAYTAFRQVLDPKYNVPSAGPSIKSEPEDQISTREVLSHSSTSTGETIERSGVLQKISHRNMEWRSVDEQKSFETYMGIYAAKRKPINEIDRMRACREFVSLAPGEQQAAIDEIRRLCRERDAVYVPMPLSHLKARGWRRTALPGPPEIQTQPREGKFTKAFRALYQKYTREDGGV